MCHWTADYCISVKFPLRRWPFILLKQWLHNMQCTTWAKIVWLSSDHRLENILLLGQNLYRALTEFSSLIVGLYHTEIDSAHSNSGSTRQYKGGNKRRNKNRRQGRQSQEDLPFLSCIWGKNRKERGLPFMTSALRGVPSKADIVSNLSKGGCVNLRTRGEGVKKSENFADVIYGSPQRKSPLLPRFLPSSQVHARKCRQGGKRKETDLFISGSFRQYVASIPWTLLSKP